MVSIRNFLNFSEIEKSKMTTLTGYLVQNDGDIHLIDSDYLTPWEITPQMYIGIPDLRFALMLQLGQMGGGNSVFFHEAIVTGAWENGGWRTSKILSRNTTQEEWKTIDVGAEKIALGKARFSRL